jgi:hypothetical protein
LGCTGTQLGSDQFLVFKAIKGGIDCPSSNLPLKSRFNLLQNCSPVRLTCQVHDGDEHGLLEDAKTFPHVYSVGN